MARKKARRAKTKEEALNRLIYFLAKTNHPRSDNPNYKVSFFGLSPKEKIMLITSHLQKNPRICYLILKFKSPYASKETHELDKAVEITTGIILENIDAIKLISETPVP